MTITIQNEKKYWDLGPTGKVSFLVLFAGNSKNKFLHNNLQDFRLKHTILFD